MKECWINAYLWVNGEIWLGPPRATKNYAIIAANNQAIYRIHVKLK